MSILMILLGIFALGIVALIHEVGHYFFARRAGIKVLELSLGAGPKVFSFTKNDILYSIRPIPILAFVKLEEEGPEGLKEGRAFSKFLMYIGGVLFNFLTAIVIFTIIGVFAGSFTDKVIVGDVVANTPASEVLLKNDQIVEFNGERITDIEDFIKKLEANGSNEATLKIMRSGAAKEVKVVPAFDQQQNKYYLGFIFGKEKMNIFSGFFYSFKVSLSYVGETFKLLTKMLVGLESPKNNLMGVVGIVSLTSTFASNIGDFLIFIAVISLGMAIINVLPIPALDGGKIVLFIIEKIRGRKVDEKIETYLTIISFGLLILLIFYITYNDILRIIGG